MSPIKLNTCCLPISLLLSRITSNVSINCDEEISWVAFCCKPLIIAANKFKLRTKKSFAQPSAFSPKFYYRIWMHLMKTGWMYCSLASPSL